jgi:protease-4
MDKPVVALVKESAASGAYWVASSSDLIIADELSIIGSIGVIGSYLQFSGLMDKYGVEYERLVAGDVKDLGSPYKELSKEEKALLQSRINEIQKYFLNDVTNSRKLSKESVAKISDGSFYLGIEAKQLGLIDEFGNMDVAFNETKRLANVTNAKLQFMQQRQSLTAALSQFTSKSSYVLGQGIGDSLKTLGRQELLSV